jgi:hypothetical protein
LIDKHDKRDNSGHHSDDRAEHVVAKFDVGGAGDDINDAVWSHG